MNLILMRPVPKWLGCRHLHFWIQLEDQQETIKRPLIPERFPVAPLHVRKSYKTNPEGCVRYFNIAGFCR